MVITQEIVYECEGVTLKGYCAAPAKKNHLPAILIAGSWAGRDEFLCTQADAIAREGYLAFAIDLYGDAKVGSSKEENMQLMTPLVADHQLLLKRLQAAYDVVSNMAQVDKSNIAALGFCFGGKCALDMARANMPIKCAISFHGALKSAITDSSDIVPKILTLHGYNDPMIPYQDVEDFQKEMDARNADWQFHSYSNTMHAFTNPEANDPDFGTVYNEKSNYRAWKLAYDFIRECFFGREKV